MSTKLESDNFVALKVEAGSVPHTQFAAICILFYVENKNIDNILTCGIFLTKCLDQNVSVPSLFFIGKSGKPIDIITDVTSANDLSTRINSVIQTHTGVAVPTPAVVNTGN